VQEADYLRTVSGTPAAEPFLQNRNALQHALVAQCFGAAITITSQHALTGGEVLLRVFRQNRKQRGDRFDIAAVGDGLFHLGHHPHDNVVLSHNYWIGRLRDLL